MIDRMARRFGIPWHGLWTRMAAYPNAETFLAPSGSTIFPPEALGVNVGGWSWEVNAGAPAVSLTSEEQAEENAAGHTWLNYGIIYGKPTSLRMGNVGLAGPIYIDDAAAPWMLEVAGGNLKFTRFGVFNNAPVAVTQSITLPAEASEIHNFSRDGRKIAFRKLDASPYGFAVYSLSGVPPAAILTHEVTYLADQYVNVTASGPTQNYHVFGLQGNDTVGWTVADEFTGDITSPEYIDWAVWGRTMQGPIGAGRTTHNDYTQIIGVMFADDGTPLPVVAHWHQDVLTTWGGGWTFTNYYYPHNYCLLGSASVADNGYFEITVGGTQMAYVDWTATSTVTFNPYTTIDQTLNVMGKAYHDAYTLSVWNGSYYNPDALQGSYAPGVNAVTYFVIYPNYLDPSGLESISCNISPFMTTNFVVMLKTGNPSSGRIRFGWRNGKLLADDLIDIPLPSSNAFACSMHPVTHEFAKLAGASDVVFI